MLCYLTYLIYHVTVKHLLCVGLLQRELHHHFIEN